MALTYNQFTTNLANFIVVPVTDPNIIDDAEQRRFPAPAERRVARGRASAVSRTPLPAPPPRPPTGVTAAAAAAAAPSPVVAARPAS